MTYRNVEATQRTFSAARPPDLLLPTEIGPHVSTSLAAGRANEARLDIRKPHVIAPLVRRDRNVVAALVVGAIDQDAAHAGRAHFRECDLLMADMRHDSADRAGWETATGRAVEYRDQRYLGPLLCRGLQSSVYSRGQHEEKISKSFSKFDRLRRFSG